MSTKDTNNQPPQQLGVTGVAAKGEGGDKIMGLLGEIEQTAQQTAQVRNYSQPRCSNITVFYNVNITFWRHNGVFERQNDVVCRQRYLLLENSTVSVVSVVIFVKVTAYFSFCFRKLTTSLSDSFVENRVK